MGQRITTGYRLGITNTRPIAVDSHEHDSETAEAIGLKSYNTLMGELVALDTQNPQSEVKNPNPEEDFVDFAAATTASLGRLKNDVAVNTSKNNPSENSNDPSLEEKQKPENDDGLTFQTDRVQHVSSPLQDKLHDQNEGASEKHDTLIKSEKDTDGQDESDLAPPVNTNVDNSSVKKKIHDEEKIDFALTVNTNVDNSSVEKIHDQEKSDLAPPVNTHVDNPPIEKIQDQSVEGNVVNLESSKDLMQSNDESESKCLTESGDGSEPIYEGEEHIQETSTANYENREPVYEGEVVLAGQVDKVRSNADEVKGKDGITPKQGELIRNFLKNSANQLTIYGLFSLQDGLKERELCFEGELYLLATDQGYINQPDLVWEKLNEVNGDTVYMTGSFKEFNAENPEPRSWDEQNALATTALAIALQQQEFDQQQQQQQQQQTQHKLPQSSAVGQSGLVTGPQVCYLLFGEF
ncbi:putative MINDY deubiquitinase [Helianthus annuus]|nr:putative MINDY deubiquitinase [Helianthus annuus]